MIKFLMILSTVILLLSIIAIINTIRLKILKKKFRKKTPKLSELKRKDFRDYIDNITKNL